MIPLSQSAYPGEEVAFKCFSNNDIVWKFGNHSSYLQEGSVIKIKMERDSLGYHTASCLTKHIDGSQVTLKGVLVVYGETFKKN